MAAPQQVVGHLTTFPNSQKISANLAPAHSVAAHELEELERAPRVAVPPPASLTESENAAQPSPRPHALNATESVAATAPASQPQSAALDLRASPAPGASPGSIMPPPVIEPAPAVTEPVQTACSLEDDAADIQAAPSNPADFGRALAAAALRQTHDLVIYTDKYRSLKFPMGDVPRLFGVCTDVVIRAYRALGVDLQARVHAARVGSGDTSIAHRRTFTLRRYFASRGASLPITDFAEDYLPGDIVTYHRPQNSGSRDHIAIVAEITGPSGMPMIIHNRGWGPQIEDALFVDKITGHYRYGRMHDQLALLALKTKLKAPKEAPKKDGVQNGDKSKSIRARLKARVAAIKRIKK